MSFEELAQKLSPKLKAIAKRLDGRYTSFDDEDLYQEALCNLWQKYQSRELGDKTDSYILQGCFFFLKNHIRKIYKGLDAKSISLHSLINDEDQTLGDILATQYDGGFKDMEAKFLLENIHALLSEKERRIFDLLVTDMTTRDIGKRFGISHAMVIKINNKIKKRCKELKKEIL